MKPSSRHVAVVGGGLTGCCTALELTLGGCNVTLYEREPSLLSRAATANEGKLHLGYVYAADASLATARVMIAGALSFGSLISRLLAIGSPDLNRSSPFIYAVHRTTQVAASEIAEYLDAAHRIVKECWTDRDSYLGIDLSTPPKLLRQSETERHLSTEQVSAAFQTAEVAIDPLKLAELLRKRIVEDPSIEVRTDTEVVGISEGSHNRISVRSRSGGLALKESYDAVVNVAWENRLALDATFGLRPPRQWIHRFKYGVRFRPARPVELASTTLVLGPLGDVVVYESGEIYASWYPACLAATSRELSVPYRPTRPAAADAQRIITETLAGLRDIAPGLQGLDPLTCEADVRGGQIVAWGRTDIDDPASGLHSRSMIGVTPHRRYFSMDPGKLTTSPLFSRLCAEAVLNS